MQIRSEVFANRQTNNDENIASLAEVISVTKQQLVTSAKVTFSSLSVCLLATLRKNFETDLHDIFREGWPMNK